MLVIINVLFCLHRVIFIAFHEDAYHTCVNKSTGQYMIELNDLFRYFGYMYTCNSNGKSQFICHLFRLVLTNVHVYFPIRCTFVCISSLHMTFLYRFVQNMALFYNTSKCASPKRLICA